MHDLIEYMGREIVRQESPLRPGERSRLWSSKDILHVLKENKGSDKTEIIVLRLWRDKKVQWDGHALKKMENLKILVIENASFSRRPTYLPKSLRVLKWCGYPGRMLPRNFDPKKLTTLNLSMSSFVLNNQRITKFKHLKEMILSHCQSLEQVPDMSGAPNLKELRLDYCMNLVEVHDSVGCLGKLELLSLDQCTNLRIFPRSINLPSLELLNLRCCNSLETFPEVAGKMENIKWVLLCCSGIRKLPFSIEKLVGLETLRMTSCKGLVELPASIFMLPKLETLEAKGCKGFAQFKKGIKGQQQQQQENRIMFSSKMTDVSFSCCNVTDEFLAAYLPYLKNVTDLVLAYNNITFLPTYINSCHTLRRLVLDGCSELREIRELPPNIKYLSALNCTSLTSHSREILLRQTLHEAGGTCFCVPGSTVPDWFDRRSGNESSLSFRFRNKFPAITICVVGVLGDFIGFSFSDFHVIVENGITQRFQYNFSISSLVGIQTDHIFLFDLQLKCRRGELETICGQNEWSDAEISYMDKCSRRDIKWMGIHVQRQNTRMADFRFTNPSDTSS